MSLRAVAALRLGLLHHGSIFVPSVVVRVTPGLQLHESNELEFSCERQGDRVQRVVARQDQIKEDGRAFEIKNIKILGQYRDPEYCLEYENEATMSPTGEWTIFCLRHPDGHWYRGRWDESKSALDIDLFTTDTARRPDKNFPGHHTDQPNPNVRTSMCTGIA
jgi:hypothetical protein